MTLIPLILYALLAAGVAFAGYKAWDGFKTSISAPYVAAQMKHDQATIDQANAAKKAAEAERDHAKSDTVACVAMTQVQNDEIGKWQAKASANLAASRAEAARSAQISASSRNQIAQWQAVAAAKEAAGQTAEQKLAAIDKLLRDAAKARAEAKATMPTVPLPGSK